VNHWAFGCICCAAAALILAYRSTRDHQGALNALAALRERGAPVNRYAFNAALRVCADAAAVDDALSLLGELRALGAAQQAKQDGQQQQQQQGRMQHGKPPSKQARQQVAACGEAAYGSSSLPPHSSRPDAASNAACDPDEADDLRTDCRSYSAALAAVTAAGRHALATRLHAWLREDGLVPDAPLCTQLLACYAQAGRAREAQRLFDEMLAGEGRRGLAAWLRRRARLTGICVWAIARYGKRHNASPAVL
jgi:pentatricopeptide repeat protein